MLLDDFAYTIVFNSRCSPEKVPEGLKELYAYLNDPNIVGESELVKNIDKRVRKFNGSKWRTRQMTFEYYLKEAKEEGLEQGRTEGEASGRAAEKLDMARAMKDDKEPITKIIKYTGLPKEEIEKL